MLRSYAAACLLVPAAVDGWSGYRYYALSQLPEARLILLLRQAEVRLSEIAAFLQDPAPERLERWEEALDLEVASRRRALADVRAQLGLLAHNRKQPERAGWRQTHDDNDAWLSNGPEPGPAHQSRRAAGQCSTIRRSGRAGRTPSRGGRQPVDARHTQSTIHRPA